jgi:hypothetical protein
MAAVDLAKMALDPSASIGAISDALDNASPSERIEAAFSLGRSEQRALYEKAKTAPPVELTHFVPADRDARTAVRHRGRNTLPLPGKHKLFEKRFCRPDDDGARLFGYNEAPSRGLIGPGYFVAVPTKNEATARGNVVIDYFQVPDGPVADGWPPVVPNSKGLQRFVYHRTRDFMRRISRHVSIGAAYKVERPLGHFFILVRED